MDFVQSIRQPITGAKGETRTLTSRTLVPKTSASTNSATFANAQSYQNKLYLAIIC